MQLKQQVTKPSSKTSVTGIGNNSNVQSGLTKKAFEPCTNGETIIIRGGSNGVDPAQVELFKSQGLKVFIAEDQTQT